jgi:long-subunit acyl-CoA synthetase (AMP-forming)
MSGLTIVFAENLDTIARDLRTTSPTLMTVVPRVCEKLQARVLASVAEASAPQQWLFTTALARALARVRERQRRPRRPGLRAGATGSATGWCSARCGPASADGCASS